MLSSFPWRAFLWARPSYSILPMLYWHWNRSNKRREEKKTHLSKLHSCFCSFFSSFFPLFDCFGVFKYVKWNKKKQIAALVVAVAAADCVGTVVCLAETKVVGWWDLLRIQHDSLQTAIFIILCTGHSKPHFICQVEKLLSHIYVYLSIST